MSLGIVLIKCFRLAIHSMYTYMSRYTCTQPNLAYFVYKMAKKLYFESN